MSCEIPKKLPHSCLISARISLQAGRLLAQVGRAAARQRSADTTARLGGSAVIADCWLSLLSSHFVSFLLTATTMSVQCKKEKGKIDMERQPHQNTNGNKRQSAGARLFDKKDSTKMATIPSSLVVDNLCGQNPTLGEQHKSEHKLGSDVEGSNLCCRLPCAKGRIFLRSNVSFQFARISDQMSCSKSDVILKLDVRSEQDLRSQFGHRCSCLISKKLSSPGFPSSYLFWLQFHCPNPAVRCGIAFRRASIFLAFRLRDSRSALDKATLALPQWRASSRRAPGPK